MRTYLSLGIASLLGACGISAANDEPAPLPNNGLAPATETVCWNADLGDELPVVVDDSLTGAPSETFRFAAGRGGEYYISLRPGFDATLDLRAGCVGQTLTSRPASLGQTTAIGVHLGRGQELLIGISGQAGASGDFELRIKGPAHDDGTVSDGDDGDGSVEVVSDCSDDSCDGYIDNGSDGTDGSDDGGYVPGGNDNGAGDGNTMTGGDDNGGDDGTVDDGGDDGSDDSGDDGSDDGWTDPDSGRVHHVRVHHVAARTVVERTK